jgi:hypothetical protein
MAITMKDDIEPYLMKHYYPLWRERFKQMGFRDAYEWSDEKLKAAVHAWAEAHTCPTCGDIR